jgi:hypothetical protein
MNTTTNLQELALLHEEDPSLFSDIECIDLTTQLCARMMQIKQQYPDAKKLPKEFLDELMRICVMMAELEREMRHFRSDRRN